MEGLMEKNIYKCWIFHLAIFDAEGKLHSLKYPATNMYFSSGFPSDLWRFMVENDPSTHQPKVDSQTPMGTTDRHPTSRKPQLGWVKTSGNQTWFAEQYPISRWTRGFPFIYPGFPQLPRHRGTKKTRKILQNPPWRMKFMVAYFHKSTMVLPYAHIGPAWLWRAFLPLAQWNFSARAGLWNPRVARGRWSNINGLEWV